MTLGIGQHARVAGAFVLSAAAALHASSVPPWAPQVDRIFHEWHTRDSPGCAAGVFQDGGVAYARGYGMADLEHEAPITPDSVFYVGSLAKQFTAFGAALAVQQGKLAYGESVRKYIPELPAYAEAITVGDLIHHTSGLRDYYALLAIAGRRWDALWDNRAVLQTAARQKRLNFDPGAKYSYSNTGYALLAIVIERATNSPFADFMEANVFRPLGMGSTLVHSDASRLIKGRAIGYERLAGRWSLDTPHSERTGAGGLYTTVPDLQRWDENFYTARVGGVKVIDDIQTRGHLRDGTPIDYAGGLEIGTYRGLRVVQHSGSLGGYRAHFERFPDQHTSIAVLCNLGSIRPQDLASQMADVVLAHRMSLPAAVGGGRVGSTIGTSPESPAPEVLGQYAGSYYSDELQSTFTFTARGASLELQRDADAAPRQIAYLGPDRFGSIGFEMHFQHDAGSVSGFLLDAGVIQGIEFVRRQPPTAAGPQPRRATRRALRR